jgi:Trp operon repressor
MARSLPYDKFNERSGPQNVIEWQKVVDLLETVITNEQFEKIRKLMIEFF